jgi:hypothetical protein
MTRKKAITDGMVTLMKTLALNGPATMWNLASIVSGNKKSGLTCFAYPTIFKYIKFLSKTGYVTKFGHQKIPTKKRGSGPKKSKSLVLPKHSDAILYGLSLKGLEFVFMENTEVREKWDIVRSNYDCAKSDVWLNLARDWMFSTKLSTFPLMRQYKGSDVRYYKPNPGLFVQSIILSVRQNGFEEALEEARKTIEKYGNRKVAFYLLKELRDEIGRLAVVLDKCRKVEPILENLRQKELNTQA